MEQPPFSLCQMYLSKAACPGEEMRMKESQESLASTARLDQEGIKGCNEKGEGEETFNQSEISS